MPHTALRFAEMLLIIGLQLSQLMPKPGLINWLEEFPVVILTVIGKAITRSGGSGGPVPDAYISAVPFISNGTRAEPAESIIPSPMISLVGGVAEKLVVPITSTSPIPFAR